MIKKLCILSFVSLMFAPNVLADRLDDAVRASNYEQVNYLLIMKGNEVSQHRKDELVLLANEATLARKRGKYPFGTIQDVQNVATGVVSSYLAYKCVRSIMATEFPNASQIEIEIILTSLRYVFFGYGFLITGFIGGVGLVQGLRSAYGRALFAQAEQIEKRINELVVAEVKS